MLIIFHTPAFSLPAELHDAELVIPETPLNHRVNFSARPRIFFGDRASHPAPETLTAKHGGQRTNPGGSVLPGVRIFRRPRDGLVS